jgi:hypothetical protein
LLPQPLEETDDVARYMINSNLNILAMMAIIVEFLNRARVLVEWEWGVEK